MTFFRRLAATARLWWRVMRMQRVTRDGWFYLAFTLAVGVAAINTGNNLLYLVLGLLVSVLLLSAFLSETVLSRLRIEREVPPYGVAGQPFRVGIVVHNRKRRLASHSLVISEVGIEGARTYVARVGPGESVRAYWVGAQPRRGVMQLAGFRITTRFPFGLFEKNREILVADRIPIHPAGVLPARAAELLPQSPGVVPLPAPGRGLDFYALREYRQGDDLRQVHWKASARTGRLHTIEKEREQQRRVTLLLDTRGAASPEALDGAADLAVGLARRLIAEGCEVGLRLPDDEVPPGGGRAQILRIADRAARMLPAPASAAAPQPFPGTAGVVVPLVPAPPPLGEERPPAPRWIPPTEGRLDLHGTQRLAVFCALGLALGSLAISGELATALALPFAASALVGFFRDRPLLGPLAANLLTLVVFLATALAVVALGLDIMLVAPGFVILLASVRLLARRGAGDDFLLLLMASMMLAGGAALTGELSYGLLFAGFAVAGTIALATTHLRREVEAVAGAAASRAPGTVTGALLSLLGGLSLLVLLGSVLLFLSFPRVSVGLLARKEGPVVGGGGDRIELGGVGVLKDDPTPVMRVRFLGGEPPREIYWRTKVFDEWDGRGWSRVQTAGRAVGGAGGLFFVRRRGGPGVEAEVEVLRDVPALPVFGDPITVRFFLRRGQPPPSLVSHDDGTLEVLHPPSPLRYRLRAAVGATGEGDPDDYRGVPPGLDPRIRRLADSFEGRDPEVLARTMVAWLQRENRYTRELPGEVGDPLAHFLFERRAGHCEYFATALAILLRLRGIPARVVAGYYGASWVEAGGYWVVREGDAHAWTEAWIPGRGWVLLDATPAEERPGHAEGAWASLVQWLDVWRMRWANWVLDFDARTQGWLFRQVGRALAGVWSFLAQGRVLLRIVAAGVVAASLALASVAFLRRLARQGGNFRATSADRRRATRLYRRVRARLRARGIELGPAATASEWAEAASRALPAEEARAVARALEAYAEARFGDRPLDTEKVRHLLRSLP